MPLLQPCAVTVRVAAAGYALDVTDETTPRPQAIVVVDMQNDYFDDPDLERCREALVKACNTAISRVREAGALVVEVRTVHSADPATWSLNMREDDCGMAIDGSHGAGTVAGLDVGDAVQVVKTRDSAFFRTDLEEQLTARGITTVALCGVSTESCIALTASDAYARDLRVVLVDDALASSDPHSHDHTLALLAEQYRQPVVRSDQLVLEAP